jgi:hypothetical protein
MDSLEAALVTISWGGVIGNALAILVVLAILLAMLRGERMSFKDKLRSRRAKERETKRRKDLLVESVRAHLLPALIKQGFAFAPRQVDGGPERKAVGISPFGQLQRNRPDGKTDLVEIQFMTYQRAAFRINACAVPKEGMMSLSGHRTAEECIALGVKDLYSHARPWLRPLLRAVRLEPLGEWFSVWHWPFRPPTKGDYDKLAMKAAGILPELESALRGGELGPHMRRLVMKPLMLGSETKALHILFRSNRFNLSKVGEHFINPCCFGEDLAVWLRPKLAEKSIETNPPYQEDWGWELPAKMETDSYYLCMSGNADNPGNDEGEWRIIVEKRRSIWDRLAGRAKITTDDPLARGIEEILSSDPAIRNVHRGE